MYRDDELYDAEAFDMGVFGTPADQTETDAAIHEFPFSHGWIPLVGPGSSPETWRAEIRRGTPAGPDTVCCGEHPTAAAGFRACGDMVRRMLEVRESGDTSLMTLMRASIRYAQQQKAG